MQADKCDAFLLVSFGGPEGREDVMPFLRNVTSGRNVPDSRLEEVAHHYYQFGGVSPINGLNRELIAALRSAFTQNGIDLPIYWGNRNWHPMLAKTIEQMKIDGVKRAVAIATSAYSSYSGCRQYIEDIERACLQVGHGAPVIEKLPPFYNADGFIEASEHRLADALAQFTEVPHWDIHVVFTAHSIPITMASHCEYERQLHATAADLAEKFEIKSYSVVYQSRSGPPTQPWLGPDICEHLRMAGEDGAQEVVICPIGFVADHMEVLYDLDFEAKNVCRELGIKVVRAGTVGVHPAFVQMICGLVQGHLKKEGPVKYCAAECCPSGR
jgi:ferrochelatase